MFEDSGQDFQNSQIWIENADGSNVRQLVSDGFTDNGASLSPDGTLVAFNADKMKLVNLDGTGVREIRTGVGPPNQCYDSLEGDAFSPDGQRIAFTRLCLKTRTFGIWTADLDGSHAREVTRDTASPAALARWQKGGRGWDLEDHRAGWSPDGKALVFNRIDTSISPERNAIFTVGIDGENLHQVTEWSVDANDPDWSPDGTEIAFNASAEPSPTQNIWTIHPDGSGLTQLTNYDEQGQATFHPSWSPDGSQILFSHSPSTDGWGDFFVMNRDGGNQQVIAKTAMHENHGQWGSSPAP